MLDRCVCPWCGGAREHTPDSVDGCTGCLCEHKPPVRHRTRVRVAQIPRPHKDVADMLAAPGGAQAYERMIAEAKPGPAWMIDNLETHGYTLTTPEGQQDAVDAMLATLLSLPRIERGAYVRQLAERLEIPETELRMALNEAWQRNGYEAPFRNVPDRDPGSLDLL